MGTNTKQFEFKLQPLASNTLLLPPRYIIKDIWPRDCMTLLKGLPGAFKTFIALAMALCAWSGLPFYGRPVRRCKPFYIGADDPDGVRLRAQAWVKYHEDQLRDLGIPLDFPDAMMLDRAVNFYKPDEVNRAAEDIKRQFKPDTITIDTFFHSTVGADLSKPDVVLPIINRIQEFLADLQAHTSMLVHHTPKDGKGFWGSIIIEGTVHAMMHCQEPKQGPLNTVVLNCERMKGAAKFKPIEITLKSHKIKTQPDEDHINEVEELVVASEPISAKPTLNERIDIMIFFLDLLGGSAIRARWFEQVKDFTAKQDKDGKGWSEDTFDRRRDELVNKGWIFGGGAQNVPYQFTDTEDVKLARTRVRNKAAQYGCTEPPENQPADLNYPHPKYPHADPLVGSAGAAGAFGDARTNRKAPANDLAGGSSISGNDQSSVVPLSSSELLKAAKEQLKGGKSSAA